MTRASIGETICKWETTLGKATSYLLVVGSWQVNLNIFELAYAVIRPDFIYIKEINIISNKGKLTRQYTLDAWEEHDANIGLMIDAK